jgi:hypothetical protein
MPIEVHDKRFGVIAVEKRFITKEQLFEALKTQVEEDLLGKPHTLIGICVINCVIHRDRFNFAKRISMP